MGTTPKPRPDAGRGKILSTALLALALLASLVTFSPFADAGGRGSGNNGGGDKYITVAWKLPSDWQPGWPGAPTDNHESIWPQSFVMSQTTNTQNLGALDQALNASKYCGMAFQVDTYKYSGDFKSGVDALIATNTLDSPGGNPQDSAFLTDERPAWKFIVNEPCPPKEPTVKIHFQKVVCEAGATIPGNNPGTPNHRAENVNWSGVVSTPVGGLRNLPELCKPAKGWQFKVAASEEAMKVGVDGNAAGGSVVSGSTDRHGVLRINAKQLPGNLGSTLLSGEKVWVSEVQKAGYGFENLHCYTDAQNADNLEFIQLSEADLAKNFVNVYCTAWNSKNPEPTPDTWSLEVFKDIPNVPGVELPDSEEPRFTVSISCEVDGEDPYSAAQSFDVGESATFDNIPEGASPCTVTETAPSDSLLPAGYRWSSPSYTVDAQNPNQSSAVVGKDDETYCLHPVSGDGVIVPFAGGIADRCVVVTNTFGEIPPPTPTIPEQPTSTTSTTEEVGGIDEEPTTTTEGPNTTEPEVLDTVVTPTTVAKQTLPRTGSNTSTVLSLAGVLMTAGAAFVLFGRRRFNAGN